MSLHMAYWMIIECVRSCWCLVQWKCGCFRDFGHHGQQICTMTMMMMTMMMMMMMMVMVMVMVMVVPGGCHAVKLLHLVPKKQKHVGSS